MLFLLISLTTAKPGTLKKDTPISWRYSGKKEYKYIYIYNKSTPEMT